MWVAALATAVVASGIGLVIALEAPSGGGHKAAPVAIASPSPTASEAASPATTQTPAPTESAAPSATPSPSASASTTSQPPSSPSTRDPATIDCTKEAQYCSDVTGSMVVKDGKLQSTKDTPSGTDYGGVPQTKMTSTVLKPDQQPAVPGDDVGWIKVHVDVVNDTSRTFVFPQRKIALVVTHNGKDDVNETSGPSTDVPPGGALHADFLNPEAQDGTYTWRAKVWFYAK
jgi:cytoskeletal protein RodZ